MIPTLLISLSLFVLSIASNTTASAAVLQVANNGLDGPQCGTKTAPCRSITRAIDLAAAGDTIVVGPGRYGDLDRDGVLGEVNEEESDVGGMIRVDKAVSVESSAGAAQTILDVAGLNRTGVLLAASGARLGRAKKGFTIFDSFGTGVSVAQSATGVVVEGNLAVATTTGFDAVADGSALLQGNVASANADGFFLASTQGAVARSNLAVANSLNGFNAAGVGTQRFEGNVALGNAAFGFIASGQDVVLTGNVATGNDQGVFGGNGVALTVTGLAAIANVKGGVHNQNTATMAVTASNLFGNGVQSIGGALNCGTVNESFPLTVTNVFWGAAAGPGDDPADDACDVLAGITTVAQVAPKPFKVQTKVPQF